MAANGSTIQTFGKRKVFLSLPGLRVVHDFLLADVKKPILGTDFFRAHDLLIDISRRRLFRLAESSPVAALEVKARPAQFVGGLCGLRRPEIPHEGRVPAARPAPLSLDAAIQDLFANFSSVTSAPVYDAAPPKLSLIHI